LTKSHPRLTVLVGTRASVRLRFLREPNENAGQTIVVITHNPTAAALAQRTMRLKDGATAAVAIA
jgi:ABC-type lipoprotein export system ATPase subunit